MLGCCWAAVLPPAGWLLPRSHPHNSNCSHQPQFLHRNCNLHRNQPPSLTFHLLQDAGEWEAAEQYYTRLLDYGAGSREQAKSALREIRTLQAAGGGGRAGLTPVRPDSPPASPGSDMAGMSPY